MDGKNVLDGINILLARLKPSQYRKYWKIWNEHFRARYSDVFGSKYRIYLDYPEDTGELITDAKSTKNIKRINIILHDCPYTKDYVVRGASDYLEGYAYKSNGTEKAKIGKLLSKALDYFKKENIPPELYDFDEALRGFNTRASLKQLSKPKLVCISRHPYDIAGMSTDRRWKSCMRLEDREEFTAAGQYSEYIESDIREGTLVAYLIYADDRNISDPLARILIKPYINVNDSSDILLVPEPTVYSDDSLSPASYRKFREVVNSWLESFQGEKTGTYMFNPELYRDKSPEAVTKVGKDKVKRIEDNITVDGNSWVLSIRDIVSMFPWLAEGKFENLLVYVDKHEPDRLVIRRGTWKSGVVVDAVLEKDTVVEGGILYSCVFRGVFKDGVFYMGSFYGTFENGIWLDGVFSNSAVWRDGVWYRGYFDGRLGNGAVDIFPKTLLNPSIVKEIASSCKSEEEFESKHKRREIEFFKTRENVERHLRILKAYEGKVREAIKDYWR